MRHRLSVRLAVLALITLCAGAGRAASADRVKVVTGSATIRVEASAASKVVAIVASGTVLDVLGQENGWYKVSVPVGLNRAARPGYIEMRVVMPTTERPVLVPLGPGGTAAASAPAARPTRMRVFGEGAWQYFTATRSMKAIFGESTGIFYGGGVEASINQSLFATVSVTHFQKTGERAFVYNGQAFRLGIEDRVALTPIMVSVGYRFVRPRWRFVPYASVGGGAAIYSEKSDQAESGDNVSKTGGAYQAVGGIEVPVAKRVAIAVEGQYLGIRGILGKSGVSQAYGEKDLGGGSVHVKVLFGL